MSENPYLSGQGLTGPRRVGSKIVRGKNQRRLQSGLGKLHTRVQGAGDVVGDDAQRDGRRSAHFSAFGPRTSHSSAVLK